MLPQIETITQSLQKMGLIKDPREAAFHPLSGGVSSDIWRVDTPSGAICVKQARRQLRVDAKWLAPVERNSIEATWMRTTGALMPGTVPRVISEDRAASLFAMTYFDPGTYLNEADKATTRQFARLNLIAPPKNLKQLANKWRNAIADGTSSL